MEWAHPGPRAYSTRPHPSAVATVVVALLLGSPTTLGSESTTAPTGPSLRSQTYIPNGARLSTPPTAAPRTTTAGRRLQLSATGAALIGARVRVEFTDGDYFGTVMVAVTRNGDVVYRITYDDNTVEWTTIPDQRREVHIVSLAVTPSPGSDVDVPPTSTASTTSTTSSTTTSSTSTTSTGPPAWDDDYGGDANDDQSHRVDDSETSADGDILSDNETKELAVYSSISMLCCCVVLHVFKRCLVCRTARLRPCLRNETAHGTSTCPSSSFETLSENKTSSSVTFVSASICEIDSIEGNKVNAAAESSVPPTVYTVSEGASNILTELANQHGYAISEADTRWDDILEVIRSDIRDSTVTTAPVLLHGRSGSAAAANPPATHVGAELDVERGSHSNAVSDVWRGISCSIIGTTGVDEAEGSDMPLPLPPFSTLFQGLEHRLEYVNGYPYPIVGEEMSNIEV